MYHSINLDDKNTWDDWHLIPSSRPVFVPPPVKTKYVDIPGLDGEKDLTNIFSEFPMFSNRVGSFEFIVANGYLSWEETYEVILDYIHGKEIRVILEDNPEYFYRGHFAVNEWRSDKNYSLIVIDYDVDPLKTETFAASDAWLWDPFDFEFGEIQYYSNLVVAGTLLITIENSEGIGEIWEWDTFDFEYGTIQLYSDVGFDRPLIPKFTTSNAMSVTFEGITYTLQAGVNIIPQLHLAPGTNEFTFTGNGTITIEYGRRSL